MLGRAANRCLCDRPDANAAVALQQRGQLRSCAAQTLQLEQFGLLCGPNFLPKKWRPSSCGRNFHLIRPAADRDRNHAAILASEQAGNPLSSIVTRFGPFS
jgi:hypothetical protein